MLGILWCCCGDEKAARCELARAMATMEAERARCCAAARREETKCENGALLSAGGRWSVEAALRRVVACAVRATATRGRRHGHAARRLCRWSATERLRSVRQLSKPSLTAGFAIELTPYAKRFSDFFQNQSRSPKYHLQMLFNDLVLTRNIN